MLGRICYFLSEQTLCLLPAMSLVRLAAFAGKTGELTKPMKTGEDRETGGENQGSQSFFRVREFPERFAASASLSLAAGCGVSGGPLPWAFCAEAFEFR